MGGLFRYTLRQWTLERLSIERKTAAFTFATCAAVKFCGDATKTPPSYDRASTHSLPCGPLPLFWHTFDGQFGESTCSEKST